jgi:hypothetical protein
MVDATPMRNLTFAALVPLFAAASPAPAGALESRPVLSADAPMGRAIAFTVDYEHEGRQGALQREVIENGVAVRRDDLIFRQSRDRLRLHSAVALYRDLSAFAGLSLALADTRSLDFDHRRGCEDTATACVGPGSSSLLRDGILPGFGAPTYGLDAETGKPFAAPSTRVFQGPARQGVEYLSLGLRYAIHNQRRDSTMPTWVVSVETRLSVGADQRFNPGDPTANRGVGLGYHQVILRSAFFRDFDGFTPSMGLWAMEPLRTSSSVYRDTGLPVALPQRRLGAHAGLELPIWSDPAGGHRIDFAFRGELEFRFRGLAQNELWEPLSGDAACATDPGRCRAGLDLDRTADGRPDPHPGVVVSPAYGIFGGDAAVAATLHRYARLRASFGMTVEQQHPLADGSSTTAAYDSPGRAFHSPAMVGWRLLCAGGAIF